MKAFVTKTLIAISALAAASLFTACGGGGGGGGPVGPVIIVHGGYWGYYHGVLFCDFVNDYCSTGVAYGIYDGGLYYNNIYYTSGPTSSGTSSGGTTSTGTTSGGTTSTGTTSTGTTSTGTTSTGTTSTGTTSTGTTSTGTTSTGSTCTSNCSTGTTSGQAIDQGTSDVNLQRGLANNAKLDARARATATQFQMDFEAARQLTQLADRMSILRQNGQLTDADREALARSALAVAGLEESEVTDAVAKTANGDKNAIESVMVKGAAHMGMPSTAVLKNQILPSLGVMVP